MTPTALEIALAAPSEPEPEIDKDELLALNKTWQTVPRSSPFYVDCDMVSDLCPINMCLEKILEMQVRQVKFPFGAVPCRNYNCLAFGMEMFSGTYHTTWGPIVDARMPADLDEVHAQLAKIDSQHHLWCSGVLVLKGFLECIQDRSISIALHFRARSCGVFFPPLACYGALALVVRVSVVALAVLVCMKSCV